MIFSYILMLFTLDIIKPTKQIILSEYMSVRMIIMCMSGMFWIRAKYYNILFLAMDPSKTGNPWQHGVFGCFDNCGICIVTYFLPCYTFGKEASP